MTAEIKADMLVAHTQKLLWEIHTSVQTIINYYGSEFHFQSKKMLSELRQNLQS